MVVPVAGDENEGKRKKKNDDGDKEKIGIIAGGISYNLLESNFLKSG
jgi:TPP-dependent indolepyruvate ferredoxin oxidoreductase alpha subunit